jgi:hypothetical protein
MKHNFLYNIILKDKIKIKNDNVFIFIVKYVFLTIFYLKNIKLISDDQIMPGQSYEKISNLTMAQPINTHGR